MASGRINGIRFNDVLFFLENLRGRSFAVPVTGNPPIPATLVAAVPASNPQFMGQAQTGRIRLIDLRLQLPNSISTVFEPFDQDSIDSTEANGYGFRLTNDRTGASVAWQLDDNPFAQTNQTTYNNTSSIDDLNLTGSTTPDTYSLEWDSDAIPPPAIVVRLGAVSAASGTPVASVSGRIAVHAGRVSAASGVPVVSISHRLIRNRLGMVSAASGTPVVSIQTRTSVPVRNFGAVSAASGVPVVSVGGRARAPTVRRGRVEAASGVPVVDITTGTIRVGYVRAASGTPVVTISEALSIRRRFGFVNAASGRPQVLIEGLASTVTRRGLVQAASGVPVVSVMGSKRPAPMPVNFREAFILSADGVDIPVDAIEISDSSIRLTPRTPIPFGAQVRVEYVDPELLDILDRAGNPLASFGEQVVGNEVLNPVDPDPPVFESAETDEEGIEVTLMLSEPVRFSQLPPGAVRDLSERVVTGATIEVGWERAETTQDTDAADYWEVRIQPDGGAFTDWRRVDATEAEFSGLDELTPHDIEVRGVVESIPGPAVSLTVVTSAPLPPGPVTSRLTYEAGGRLTMSWTPIQNAALYDVDIRLGGDGSPWRPLGDGEFTGNAVNGDPNDLDNLPTLAELGRNTIDVRVRARDSADRLLTEYGIIRVYEPPPQRGTVEAASGVPIASVSARAFTPTIRRGQIIALDQPAQTVTIATPDIRISYPNQETDTVYEIADVTVNVSANQESGPFTIPERTGTNPDDASDTVTVPAVAGELIALSLDERRPRIVWTGVSVTGGTGDNEGTGFVGGSEENLTFNETLPASGVPVVSVSGRRAIVPIQRGAVSAASGSPVVSVRGLAVSPLPDGPPVLPNSYRTAGGILVFISQSIPGISRYEFQIRYSADPSNGDWVTIGYRSGTNGAFTAGGSVPGRSYTGTVEARIRGVTSANIPATRWGTSRVLVQR